jgi:hypothetical protein
VRERSGRARILRVRRPGQAQVTPSPSFGEFGNPKSSLAFEDSESGFPKR